MQNVSALDNFVAVVITPEFLKPYDFDTEVLDVIIGGQSAVDSAHKFRIRSVEDAHKFMEGYGYTLDNPIERAELFGNFQESLSFIRRYFLQPENPEGLKLEIPRKIAELSDIAQLLMYVSPSSPLGQAAASGQPSLASWACAVLKVMHTIAHVDKDLRTPYFLDIQTQILDRFYKFIFSDENGQVFLGKNIRDPNRVDLVSFESKPKKARDSVVIKLLHKPENVAEDIFDRVGIRFVTRNRFDALRVVKFLKDRYVVMPANLKPSRSRNTLVHIRRFTAALGKLVDDVKEAHLAPGDLYQKLVDATENARVDVDSLENPHTSQYYRAIQFTCRQLIKIKNPLFDDLKVLKKAMRSATVPEEISSIVGRMDLSNIQKEIRFFYPYEVQVLDEKSHVENLAGQSSHTKYKKSQVQAAMKRVMGDLMRFGEQAVTVQEQGQEHS